jgi:hypothetical protein
VRENHTSPVRLCSIRRDVAEELKLGDVYFIVSAKWRNTWARYVGVSSSTTASRVSSRLTSFDHVQISTEMMDNAISEVSLALGSTERQVQHDKMRKDREAKHGDSKEGKAESKETKEHKGEVKTGAWCCRVVYCCSYVVPAETKEMKATSSYSDLATLIGALLSLSRGRCSGSFLVALFASQGGQCGLAKLTTQTFSFRSGLSLYLLVRQCIKSGAFAVTGLDGPAA